MIRLQIEVQSIGHHTNLPTYELRTVPERYQASTVHSLSSRQIVESAVGVWKIDSRSVLDNAGNSNPNRAHQSALLHQSFGGAEYNGNAPIYDITGKGSGYLGRIGIEVDKGAIEIGKYDVRFHLVVSNTGLASGSYSDRIKVEGLIASRQE